MTPNKAFQSGHARAFIEQDFLSHNCKLYVTLESGVALVPDAKSVMMKVIPEGTRMIEEDAFLIWGEMMEDTIVDVLKAVAKAFDLYSDDSSYHRGFAEGENKVLREWRDHLLGGPPGEPQYEQLTLFDPAPYEVPRRKVRDNPQA